MPNFGDFMSISGFDQFKDLLSIAVQDVDFIRKNTILQDATHLQVLLDRIGALTADTTFRLDYSDIISSMGLLIQDISSGTIKFDPKGFETILSKYREATVDTPRRLFKKATSTDGISYFLSDGGLGGTAQGVLMLNEKLEVVRRFPNFGTDVAGGDYADPSSAIHFTVSAVEYVAISDFTNHVVQIYLYDAPYTKVATIGTVANAGADATHLTQPNGLAVDETNALMYISNATGQPAGASASNGFVAVCDISTPGTPAFDSIPLYYDNTGALLDAEVYTPVDLFYDGTLLWLSNNGNDTVGAFDVSGTSPVCVRFIEAQGAGYTFRGPQQVYVRSLVGGFKRLYVSNGNTGTVEEFDGVTYEHLATYGIRASEDNLSTYTRMSSVVYGALGLPQGVVADSVTINGQTTNVLIVTDSLNTRVQRFNLDSYTEDNLVNFGWISSDVPVILNGWSLSGNLPLDMVSVQYKTTDTEPFRTLTQDTSTPASRTFKFRLKIQLDAQKFIRSDWVAQTLQVHGRQA